MSPFAQKPERGPRITVSVVLHESPWEEIESLVGLLTRNRSLLQASFIDNSSTDALRPLIESAGAEYAWPGENLGYGSGHNLAIRRNLQRSTYHLVCNPDITCSLESILRLAAFMDANPEVGLVMPQVLYPDGRPQRLCRLLPSPVDLVVRRFLPPCIGMLQAGRDRYELRDLDMSRTRLAPSLSGCFMFLRTSTLRDAGLFDPRFFMYMEDVDLCRRIGAISHTVFYPDVTVLHGYSRGSYKNRRLLGYHMASAVRYFNKWGWLRDPERRRLNRRTGVYPADGEQSSVELELPMHLEVS